MRKKLMVFVLAAILCLGMTVPVMADYVEKEVMVETTAEADCEVWEYIGEEVSMTDIVWYLQEGIGTNVDYGDLLYCRDFGFKFSEGYVIPESGIQVTFTDENISPDKAYIMVGIYVKMIDAVNYEYEYFVQRMPVTVTAGAISGTCTLPEVYEIFYVEVKSADAGTSTPSGNGGAPSPSVDNTVIVPDPAPVEITFTAADGTAMNWITSKQNKDISISGSQTNIPVGAEFDVAKIVGGDEAVRVANAVTNAKGAVNYVAYEFNLTTENGQPITRFDGHIDVSMPIPNELSIADGKVISVYYVTDTGKLEKCNSVIDGNFITFGTTHFSTFVYVEETAASAASTPVTNAPTSPKTGEGNAALYMTMLAVAALGIGVYGARKRYI